VWKYGRHPICDVEIRRGKKEERKMKEEETTGQNIMVCPIPYGDHKEETHGKNIMACPII